MAINKKLIHFNKKESFNTELANNNILNTSIVFIKDSKEIWTHGQLYATQLTTAEIEAIVANSPSVEDALAQIAAEVTARDKAVMAEKHRAEQAEAALSSAIESEIARSTAKDEAHTAAINKEVQDRTNAIATEVTNRDAAIEVETNRALDAERTLQTNINSANTAISNEVARATEAEQLIQTNLTTEINRAKAAEQSLDSKITDHTNITDTALALKADKSDTYTKSQVDQKVSGLYKVKGSSTFEDLPKTNAVGDTYNITNSFTLNEVVYPAGTNIVYTGNGWDALSGVFDTTALEGSIQTVADNLTKESVRAKEAESALSTSIANEVTNRTQVDTAIQSNITTLTNKVNANEIKLSTIQGDYKTEGSINKALEDAKAYTNSVVSGLDSTVTDTDGNVSVSITETDGKLFNVDVNVDEESMASVMAGLMGNPAGAKGHTAKDMNSLVANGIYYCNNLSDTDPVGNLHYPSSNSRYWLLNVSVTNGKVVQTAYRIGNINVECYSRDGDTAGYWSSWTRIDNFGYNSLAELSSGVAGVFQTLNKNTLVQSGLLHSQVMIEGDVNDIVGNTIVQIRPLDAGSNINNLPVEEYGILVNFTNELTTNPNKAYYRSQTFYTTSKIYYRIFNSQWSSWQRIDNFGYNSLAELATGVAGNIGIKKQELALNSGESMSIGGMTKGFIIMHSSYSGLSAVFLTGAYEIVKVTETDGFSNHFDVTKEGSLLVVKNKHSSSRNMSITYIA